MSRMVRRGRIAQVAAVLLGAVVLASTAFTVVLDARVRTAGTGGPVVESLSIAAAAIPATLVAVLLAARRPRNPIGWLLFGILLVGASPSSEYDILDYRMRHGTLPLGSLSVIVQECWPLFLAFVAILLWVFPDGKLPAGRWRRLSVVLLVTGLEIAVTASLTGVVAVAKHDVHIAALFNPLRRRVQRMVDRRFNRSRYNAEAVVAGFTARMRQTVDFDAVRDDLVGVVHEAFQPTQVPMWLVEARSGHETGS